MLEIGDRITLTLEEIVGGNGIVSLPHPEFLRDIEPAPRCCWMTAICNSACMRQMAAISFVKSSSAAL